MSNECNYEKNSVDHENEKIISLYTKRNLDCIIQIQILLQKIKYKNKDILIKMQLN